MCCTWLPPISNALLTPSLSPAGHSVASAAGAHTNPNAVQPIWTIESRPGSCQQTCSAFCAHQHMVWCWVACRVVNEGWREWRERRRRRRRGRGGCRREAATTTQQLEPEQQQQQQEHPLSIAPPINQPTKQPNRTWTNQQVTKHSLEPDCLIDWLTLEWVENATDWVCADKLRPIINFSWLFLKIFSFFCANQLENLY